MRRQHAVTIRGLEVDLEYEKVDGVIMWAFINPQPFTEEDLTPEETDAIDIELWEIINEPYD